MKPGNVLGETEKDWMDAIPVLVWNSARVLGWTWVSVGVLFVILTMSKGANFFGPVPVVFLGACLLWCKLWSLWTVAVVSSILLISGFPAFASHPVLLAANVLFCGGSIVIALGTRYRVLTLCGSEEGSLSNRGVTVLSVWLFTILSLVIMATMSGAR